MTGHRLVRKCEVFYSGMLIQRFCVFELKWSGMSHLHDIENSKICIGGKMHACACACVYVCVYNRDITDLQYKSTAVLVTAEELNQNLANMHAHYKG
jgi:hypothetical protein